MIFYNFNLVFCTGYSQPVGAVKTFHLQLQFLSVVQWRGSLLTMFAKNRQELNSDSTSDQSEHVYQGAASLYPLKTVFYLDQSSGMDNAISKETRMSDSQNPVIEDDIYANQKVDILKGQGKLPISADVDLRVESGNNLVHPPSSQEKTKEAAAAEINNKDTSAQIRIESDEEAQDIDEPEEPEDDDDSLSDDSATEPPNKKTKIKSRDLLFDFTFE